MQKVSLIVACDSKYGIGKFNKLPWHIKPDMKFFNNITKDCCVVMGRNTWESIPEKFRGLADRLNIIISSTYNEYSISSQNNTKAECYLAKTIAEFWKIYKYVGKGKEIFIIGGSNLYKHFLSEPKSIKTIYMTKIKHSYDCDTFFPGTELLKFLETPNKITKLVSDTCLDNLNNIQVKYEIIQIETINTNIIKDEPILYQPNFVITNVSVKNNTKEYNYLKLLEKIVDEGEKRMTRNGYTLSLFSGELEFDLTNNVLPIITTRKIFTRGIFEELMFFIKGQTDSKILEEKNINIWKGNSSKEFLANRNLNYDEGRIGPMYGYQWRNYGLNYKNYLQDTSLRGYDQLYELIKNLIQDKFSRRHMMTTFNPEAVSECVLPPCHGIITQFYVSESNELDMKVYCRSSDMFHGLPFNITSYCMMLHLIGFICGYQPRKVIFTLGDIHIYEQHLDAVKELLKREPYEYPKINIKKCFEGERSVDNMMKVLESFEYSDIEIIGYQSHSGIKVEMVV